MRRRVLAPDRSSAAASIVTTLVDHCDDADCGSRDEQAKDCGVRDIGSWPSSGGCSCALRWLGSDTEVPEYQRRPHIFTHYRLEPPRLRHFWRLHNESGNIWTHFFAGCYMSTRLVAFASGQDMSWSVGWPRCAYVWCILMYYFTSLFVFGVSVQYHWRMSAPEREFLCWRCLDQSGCLALVVVGFLSGIPMGFHCDERLRLAYVALSVLVCATMAVLLTRIPKTESGAISAVIICGAMVAVMPAIHWLLTSAAGRRAAGGRFAMSMMLAILAATVFTKTWPECALPGRFDLVGSSHQIWHVLIFIVIVQYGDVLTAVYELTGRPSEYCA